VESGGGGSELPVLVDKLEVHLEESHGFSGHWCGLSLMVCWLW
jgi:hypothetical protein